MPDRAHVGLDNPAFNGRLRQPPTGSQRSFRSDTAVRNRAPGKYINNDITPQEAQVPVQQASLPTISVVPAQPYAQPARSRQQQTKVLARSSVPRPVATPNVSRAVRTPASSSSPEKRSRSQVALLMMAATVFLVGIFVSMMTLQTNHTVKTQVAALAKKSNNGEGTGDVPGETKPGNISGYQVAPNMPKFLKISSLSVNARVKPMGVTSKNELQAPSNIYDTGWYNASAHPGDDGGTGAVLIDGHVHGPTLPGVFANLKTVQPGAIIQVVRGDNKVFSYVVVKIQDYDAQNLNLGIALASAQPGKPGLNLITCGGTYDHASAQYTKRTIVFAVQQS